MIGALGLVALALLGAIVWWRIRRRQGAAAERMSQAWRGYPDRRR